VPKAKPHPDQFGFSFEPPRHSSLPAGLAGLERQICGAVGTILNSSKQTRAVIAAEMSDQLDEVVSKEMLDAYSSGARTGHKVIMSRFLALVAVTKRHDVLDLVLREIGAAVLIDKELHTARIGQLELAIGEAQRELKKLKATAPLIRGGKEA